MPKSEFFFEDEDFDADPVESEFLYAVHSYLYSKDFMFSRAYREYEDGEIINDGNIAILMNGFCHVYCSRVLKNHIIVGFGDMPVFIDEKQPNYPLQLQEIFELHKGEVNYFDEMEESSYALFSLDALDQYDEDIGIDPSILQPFLSVCRHHTESLLLFIENYGGAKIDEWDEDTLEEAFLSFLNYLNETIVPKLQTYDDEGVSKKSLRKYALI